MKELNLLFRTPRNDHIEFDPDEVIDAIRKQMPRLYELVAHARQDADQIRRTGCAPRLLNLARDMELVAVHLLGNLDERTDNPMTIDGEAMQVTA